MRFLLDTNVCILLLRGKDALLTQRLHSHQPADVALCSVVIAELYYGAFLSNQPSVHQTDVYNFVQPYRSFGFDDKSAKEFGSLRAHLKRLGTPIGPYDLMIAAIAMTNGLTIVTHNTAEFSRVPGLAIDDWQIP
jgi:tRNA(fMet)-specific endonuclease VapC